MSDKKFILNADDFGMSEAYNRAVLEGYSAGILKSASLVANGLAFEEAYTKIIPACPDLGVGIHLNVIEGKPLCSDLDSLVNRDGNFYNGYGALIIKSLYDRVFMEQIEREFRAQIEKILAVTPVSHIDSHVHVHAIPNIFELVCKLAKEYGIKQIRTQFEQPYVIPDVFKHLTIKYPINLIKVALLNTFTLLNKENVKRYGLNTNDNLIGVGYTSMMNSLTISYGLMAIKEEQVIAEALIHPCRYEDGTIDGHFTEFMITKNEKLKEKIAKIGFEITNYKEIQAAAKITESESVCEQK